MRTTRQSIRGVLPCPLVVVFMSIAIAQACRLTDPKLAEMRANRGLKQPP